MRNASHIQDVMKKNFIVRGSAAVLSGVIMLLIPVFAFAGLVDSGDMGQFGTFAQNFGRFLNKYVVPFMYALCFLFFIWGVFLYFIAGGAREEKREQGRQFMVYAVIGFVAITALWSIVVFVYDTIGLNENRQFKEPSLIRFNSF